MRRSLAVLLMTTFFAGPALAEIDIQNAWARETPPGGSHGAGYVQIHNHSDNTQTLVGARFEGAETVEIHRTIDEDGMARMEEMEQGIEIPPHETVRLEPGSYHLMLMGLPSALVKGDEHELVLEFEPGQEQTTVLTVKSRDSDGRNQHDHHHH